MTEAMIGASLSKPYTTMTSCMCMFAWCLDQPLTTNHFLCHALLQKELKQNHEQSSYLLIGNNKDRDY